MPKLPTSAGVNQLGVGTFVMTPATPAELSPYKVTDIAARFPFLDDPKNFKITSRIFTKILNEICHCGVYYRACAAANFTMTGFKNLREKHPELNEIILEARENYQERLTHTIHNRAVEGWDEPVFYQGAQVGCVRKFSDRLLELQAKRFVPDYREQSSVDVNVSGGILVVSTPSMTKEEWLEQRRQKQLAEEHQIHEGNVLPSGQTQKELSHG